jgi:hypothetical protein
MTILKSSLTLILAGALITAACGDSKSSMNPAAPSAVAAADGHNVEADDASGGVSGPAGGPKNDNGNGNGNGNGGGQDKDKGKDQPTVPSAPQPPGSTTPTAPGLKKVELEGLISAKSGDAITVNAQTVVVPPTCPIRHGSTAFTFSDLKVGDRVHVRASRTTVGAGATASTTLEAQEVKLQNPGSGDVDDEDPTDLVSVAATDALASETAGNTGTFRLTRAGTATLLAAPLTVSFTLTGTATNGTDYQNLPLTATFPANHATVDVVVTPLADSGTEGSEGVILTLSGASPYEIGSPEAATVTIADTDSPLVGVAAFDSTASETGPDLGTFRFSRTGSTAASLTVTFTVTGTAANGTDYQSVPLTVTFGAGQSTADLFVIPFPAGTAEGAETVIVTVEEGTTYDVVVPSSATVTIAG